MTDRELIELAAKAAGYDYMPANGAIVVDGIPGKWNPLESDADALRLAVKLRLMVDVNEFSVDCADCEIGSEIIVELVIDDPYAATRRAITRAAAEIGKEMGK